MSDSPKIRRIKSHKLTTMDDTVVMTTRKNRTS